MSRRSLRTAPRWAAAALLTVLILAGCGAPRESSGIADLALEPRISDRSYVGREACVECHEGNAAGFAHTGMGQSFYPMTPDRVVEDFENENELVDARTGVHYRMERRGDRFYQRQWVPDSFGRETAVDERELVWAVGSNNHSRGYMTLVGDRLFQAPVCWDPTYEFWMFCPGFEHKNDHFGREVSYSCMFCHNGRTELVEGERNAFRDPLPHGIGCERCHGPGSEHVERRKVPSWTDPAQPDPTIVNPSRLPRRERIEVCFQCHLGDTSATVRVVRHGKTLGDFRPGQRITDVLVPFRFRQATEHGFGLVGQVDRLLLSRCYLESEGRMECLTCHNPHVTVYDREPGSFRDNCMTCHEPQACTEEESRRQATAFPDDCIACHMYRGETTDRRFARFTDHWIRRRIDTEKDRRTDLHLEPIFPDELAAYPAGEQSYYRARANFLRALESPARDRPFFWKQAMESFEEAIRLGFDEADAWFFLGKARMYTAAWEPAMAAFRESLARQPGRNDASFALGQSMTALGRFAEASENFAAMLERDPEDPMALAEFGRVQSELGHHEEALAAFRRAVQAEPWNGELYLNLAKVLAILGRIEEAARVSGEAVRYDPDSLDAWGFRMNIMAGHPVEEREARLRFDQLRRAGVR